MSRLSRAGILVLALWCPMFAFATAPTPQGVADIEKLFGFDVMIDVVFEKQFKQFDDVDAFKTLSAKKKTCLLDLLRADMHSAMGKSMGEMFVDQQTIAAWKDFALTNGGGIFLQAMRDTVMATATGEPTPDMAAVMTALNAADTADVASFMQSPAAHVLEKGFPEMPTSDDTAMDQKFEQCGIVAGLM